MSYTVVTKGNIRNLGAGSVEAKSAELQPNYTVEYDGYGLITGRAVFKCSLSAAKARTPKRGDVFPGTEKRLKCHRASFTAQSGGLATITAEYIGIETGTVTNMILQGDAGTASEPITSHPKFKSLLQTKGWVREKQAFLEGDNNVQSLADQNYLTGTKSFLRPHIQITGTFYTSNKSLVSTYIADVGKTFAGIPNADFSIYTGIANRDSIFHVDCGLITGVSHEEFGNLYKIKVNMRIAPGGWHKYIYEGSK